MRPCKTSPSAWQQHNVYFCCHLDCLKCLNKVYVGRVEGRAPDECLRANPLAEDGERGFCCPLSERRFRHRSPGSFQYSAGMMPKGSALSVLCSLVLRKSATGPNLRKKSGKNAGKNVQGNHGLVHQWSREATCETRRGTPWWLCGTRLLLDAWASVLRSVALVVVVGGGCWGSSICVFFGGAEGRRASTSLCGTYSSAALEIRAILGYLAPSKVAHPAICIAAWKGMQPVTPHGYAQQHPVD